MHIELSKKKQLEWEFALVSSLILKNLYLRKYVNDFGFLESKFNTNSKVISWTAQLLTP